MSYKKGQVWNKAKNKLMIEFEKSTNKSALRGGKITGQFEYWLWQQSKKPKTKPKPKSKIVTVKPKQSSKAKPKTKLKVDVAKYWNRLPQKRRVMFLSELVNVEAYATINKKKQWIDLKPLLRKEIKKERNIRVLKEIYNLSNTEFDEIWNEDDEYSFDAPDEIENGDYVDFGAYGNLYVVHRRDDRNFWVTDLVDERYNDNAPGWIIGISQAKRIIGKG